MKQIFLIISAIAVLGSCGHADNRTASINKTEILRDDSIKQQKNKPVLKSRECSYDNEVASLGLGLVIVPTKFDIYNDSLLTKIFLSRDMYSEEDSLKNICSKFYLPDYGIMHFVCTDVTEKSYKVLINYSQVKYLPKINDYKFESWGHYITSSFGIRRSESDKEGINLEAESLRKEPFDDSDTLSIPNGFEMFCALQVRGDWVKVAYDCFYNLEENKHEGEPCNNYINKCKNPLTGWLKWRQDNKILIDIMLMP